MPELPEVETIRRALEPAIRGCRIRSLEVWQPRLRYPVPPELARIITGQRITELSRRAKYLIFHLEEQNWLLVHLGMSGRLHLTDMAEARGPHDHWEIRLSHRVLRMHDPRRFSLLLKGQGNPGLHPLLASLGPEPLAPGFGGPAWVQALRARKAPVKSLLLDGRLIAGVGNIYASEALFRAGIDPRRSGNRIGATRARILGTAIRLVLKEALEAGGSTLRDYRHPNGDPGSFRVRWRVYGREGEPCPDCGETIRRIRIGQRSSFFCPSCQH
jgi:formamidopyrimidine-DNA glycosylase